MTEKQYLDYDGLELYDGLLKSEISDDYAEKSHTHTKSQITDFPAIPAASSTTPKMDGTAAAGTETAWAKGDHVHPTDTSRAPLASPAFTGTPTAPTAAASTDSTQIATTAFVKAVVGGLDTGVTGVKGGAEDDYRTGQVNLTPANVGAAPTSHASTATTYGVGNASNYGHVKLSDATNGTAAAASGGTAATPKAVSDALAAAKSYADGKADVNTTYTLTKSGSTITLTGSDESTMSVTDSDTTDLTAMTGTLGVNHGGTGASTLGAGVVYHSASGTGAMSIATAANIVSAIGTNAVARATADASGNNIADTYAKKADISNAYRYKGSVAAYSNLPSTGNTAGDVYNVEAAYGDYPAGTNWAWTGTAWDALGGSFAISSITTAQINALFGITA